MSRVAQTISDFRKPIYLGASLALLTFVSATPAAAQISESVTISNSYGFVFDGLAMPVPVAGGTKETIYKGNYLPSSQSELGINYTGIADAGGFFFLHDNYCVGNCATYSQTVITFTITNTGDGVEALRFDSQITPGHLARIFGQEGMSASFQFDVTQTLNEQTRTLYSASGSATDQGLTLDTGGLAYNGLKSVAGENFEVMDWGATNLSLDLDRLTGFQTMQVTYKATYMSSVTANCANIFNCSGVQVVFGDPRNNGGVIDAAARFAGSDADPVIPVIGGEYDPFFVRARFANQGDPLPEQPGRFIPATYNALFVSRAAIPEPASWALMILGFGAAGAAARRRDAGLAAA